MKILVLGGYGTFGSRLIRLLAAESNLEFIVSGRSADKARAFCTGLQAAAKCTPLCFDRDADVDAQIRASAPDLLVDASGPFQAYGERPYRVVEACLRHNVHYLDLADGSEFVQGIRSYDEQAREKGLSIISGASTFPVLNAAAFRELRKHVKTLCALRAGIAPSPYAGVGLNVVRAIAGYAGKPVPIRRNGGRETAYPFTESMRYVIAPAGRIPLRPVRFSLVDVPDLRVMSEYYPELQSVWVGAGPMPGFLHALLRLLARGVRFHLLPGLAPLAPLMHKAVNLLYFGEHRGGMFVELEGFDTQGNAVTASWHLLAEGDDGPFIPSMPAAAIILHCLQGKPPAPGARPCAEEVELADYDYFFRTRSIHTGLHVPDPLDTASALYRRILGPAWQSLPEPIRRMHELDGALTAIGKANVSRGRSWWSRFAGWLFRFPPAGTDVDVEVRFTEAKGKQYWQRRFGSHVFSSIQYAGSGRYDRLLCERFGLFTFALALVAEADRLHLVIRGWSFMGLPLPMVLAPKNTSFESAEDGCFHFNVDIGLPVGGNIVHYEGRLEPVSERNHDRSGRNDPARLDNGMQQEV